jgi:AraC-like DNA-binding protein
MTAWRPAVPGIAEVFHARFVDHAYPAHTHDTWTLLIVDDGAIRFDLEQHGHGAVGPTVTLLPPHVSHDGRPATQHGFRKRVLYLDISVLDEQLTGAAVDQPSLRDAVLRRRIHQLHAALEHPADGLEAESRLALIRERLHQHLRQHATEPAGDQHRRSLAEELRDLLDTRTTSGVTLREAGELLYAHPGHLVRSFTRAFGLPPHLYLTGRRIDQARRLLLAGQRSAEVAVEVGFHDQSHMTRHFVRHLGASPGQYATGDGHHHDPSTGPQTVVPGAGDDTRGP